MVVRMVMLAVKVPESNHCSGRVGCNGVNSWWRVGKDDDRDDGDDLYAEKAHLCHEFVVRVGTLNDSRLDVISCRVVTAAAGEDLTVRRGFSVVQVCLVSLEGLQNTQNITITIDIQQNK